MRKKFIRDSRSPTPLNENVSRVMSANKSKDTQPEKILRRSLFANGVRGYRLNWRKASGKPDIAFPGKKIAIFVHGCYWHRCPKCNLRLPKTNKEFWKSKFEKNIIRDKENKQSLIDIGWFVLILWECEIKDDLQGCTTKVKMVLKSTERG